MRAKIGDVVIDKTYNKRGNLAIVVGEGISQPILIDHRGGITMDKLRDYFAVWDGLEVIGHIDFEKIWEEALKINEQNSSEKPNNCEHITEDGVTCAKYHACDDCLDNPLNKLKGSERLVKGSEQTDCQTCKWWSSYGYCVHRECKGYEPQTDCGDFADRLAYERGVKHAWEVAQKVFDSTVTFYEAEDVAKQIDKDINVRSKDEPQTERSE